MAKEEFRNLYIPAPDNDEFVIPDKGVVRMGKDRLLIARPTGKGIGKRQRYTYDSVTFFKVTVPSGHSEDLPLVEEDIKLPLSKTLLYKDPNIAVFDAMNELERKNEKLNAKADLKAGIADVKSHLKNTFRFRK